MDDSSYKVNKEKAKCTTNYRVDRIDSVRICLSAKARGRSTNEPRCGYELISGLLMPQSAKIKDSIVGREQGKEKNDVVLANFWTYFRNYHGL